MLDSKGMVYNVDDVVKSYCLFVCLMVFSTTFNNISVISWQSALLVEETGENHRPVTDQLYHIMLYASP